MAAKTYDFLLIGRGIAGSLLGRALRAGGANVGYVDAPVQTAATSVAAGIINPITGRRFVKSWLIDDLLPVAAVTYRQWEKEVGEQLYFERPLYRTLFNRGDENDWMARAADPAYADYLGPVSHEPPSGYAGRVLPAYAYGRVLRAAQVRIDRAVELSSRPLVEAGELHHDTFDYSQLQINGDGVSYRDLRADHLIFCEGWRNRFNPWFGHLPLRGNKGQVLTARLAGPPPGEILKHRVFTVPYADGNCWVGASSENIFADDAPTPEQGKLLENRLADCWTAGYELLSHRAAVRPTVTDRRPIIGRHPEHARLGIFNGLGTKGASLGPYWAVRAAAYWLRSEELGTEVGLERFGSTK